MGFVDGETVQRAVELAVAPRSRRWRWVLPSRQGSVPARELEIGGEAVGAGDLADQLGGRQGAAARQRQQLRRLGLDERGELALERPDTTRALADRAHQLARHPHPHGLLGPGQAPADPVEPLVAVERPGGNLELRPEVVQVPAQAALVV
jgi:hypothetical protein